MLLSQMTFVKSMLSIQCFLKEYLPGPYIVSDLPKDKRQGYSLQNMFCDGGGRLLQNSELNVQGTKRCKLSGLKCILREIFWFFYTSLIFYFGL